MSLSHGPLFCDVLDCSLPGSSVHVISQARILEWVAISFSRASSQPWDWTHISWVGRQRLYHWVALELLYDCSKKALLRLVVIDLLGNQSTPPYFSHITLSLAANSLGLNPIKSFLYRTNKIRGLGEFRRYSGRLSSWWCFCWIRREIWAWRRMKTKGLMERKSYREEGWVGKLKTDICLKLDLNMYCSYNNV